jgi:hypothetical protein
MVVVFHDAQSSKAGSDDAMRQNYVEYGRRLAKLLGEMKK